MNLQDFKSRPEVTDAIAASVEVALKQIGEDPKREGLVKTPHRVGEALQFLCKGNRRQLFKRYEGGYKSCKCRRLY